MKVSCIWDHAHHMNFLLIWWVWAFEFTCKTHATHYIYVIFMQNIPYSRILSKFFKIYCVIKHTTCAHMYYAFIDIQHRFNKKYIT